VAALTRQAHPLPAITHLHKAVEVGFASLSPSSAKEEKPLRDRHACNFTAKKTTCLAQTGKEIVDNISNTMPLAVLN
jgi:hypothetical protein